MDGREYLFVVNQNGSIQHSTVEYKEDGDVLVDMTDLKNVAAGADKFIDKVDATKGYTVWNKYAVAPGEEGRVVLYVDYLDPTKVMSFKNYDAATTTTP